MKRTDLTTGSDYLHNRSNDWLVGGYSNKRATVLSDDRWATHRGYTSRHTEFTLADGSTVKVWGSKRSDGNSVLVRFAPDSRYPDGEVALVLPAHLRGPWAEAKAEADAAQQAREARRQRDANAEAARTAHVNALRARVTAATGRTDYLYPDHGSVRGLSTATLEALLDLAEGKAPTT